MDTGIRTFEIAHCLGRGGFGEVYRATMRTQGGLESDVAVKVLRRDVDPAGQAVQRLRDEGRLLAKLDHPVILRVHDLAVLEGRVALVTEYIAGEDLETVMKGAGRIEVRGLLEVIGKVGHALDAAWNAPLRDGTPLQLVHRDIKPSNIRIGRHGEVKLLDFGIARTDAVAREARTRTDMMVGSPAYMAPERFKSNTTDPASDVFALGATLFEGVSRRRFYGRMDFPRIAGLGLDAESYAEHVDDQLGRIENKADPELIQLIRDSLERDTTKRITASELADRAELLAEKLGGDALGRWCRSRQWREEKKEVAELTGKTLSGDTIERVAPVTPKVDEPVATPVLNIGSLDETAPVQAPVEVQIAEPVARRTPAWVWGMVAVFAVGGGVAGLGALGVGGLAWNAIQNGEQTPEIPEEGTEAEVPVPEPEPEPVAAPEPEPEVPPQPVERPRPAPSVAPAEPEPEPEVPATAEFIVTNADKYGYVVKASGPGGEVPLPGVLGPGQWKVMLTPPGGTAFVVQTVDVEGGQIWSVACKRGSQCLVQKVE